MGNTFGEARLFSLYSRQVSVAVFGFLKGLGLSGIGLHSGISLNIDLSRPFDYPSPSGRLHARGRHGRFIEDPERVVLGTARQMSPEQLSGRKTFQSESLARLMNHHATQPHALPLAVRAELPQACRAIADRTVQQYAAQRYQRRWELAEPCVPA